ncbi:hypothetical protein HZS_3107, partial [Henneguya salminicola]
MEIQKRPNGVQIKEAVLKRSGNSMQNSKGVTKSKPQQSNSPVRMPLDAIFNSKSPVIEQPNIGGRPQVEEIRRDPRLIYNIEANQNIIQSQTSSRESISEKSPSVWDRLDKRYGGFF